MHKFTIAILAALLMAPSLAHAQVSGNPDTVPYVPLPPKEMTHIYSPPQCEFTAGFPQEPYITERCDGGENRDECYNQVSYTATFGLSATVDVKIICNPIDDGIKEKYDRNIMLKTLQAMASETIENQYEVNYNEDEQGRYKTASLVGEILVGMSPGIYMAQMWIGEESAMTVEAQLIGDPIEEADAMFRDILRSIYYKTDAEEADATDTDEEAPSTAE